MALGFMRRHRRWLYVFLWLVIAAFIILYIPAFQGESAGSPAQTLALVGDESISVGEFQRAYLRQRQFYERLYQGRSSTRRCCGASASKSRFSRDWSKSGWCVLEARRLGLSVPDAAVAKMLATSPEFQENGRFMGGAEIKRRLELQGVTVRGVRGIASAPHAPRAARRRS